MDFILNPIDTWLNEGAPNKKLCSVCHQCAIWALNLGSSLASCHSQLEIVRAMDMNTDWVVWLWLAHNGPQFKFANLFWTNKNAWKSTWQNCDRNQVKSFQVILWKKSTQSWILWPKGILMVNQWRMSLEKISWTQLQLSKKLCNEWELLSWEWKQKIHSSAWSFMQCLWMPLHWEC